MSIAFLSTVGTSDLVNQIGAYNQYGGKGHDAATILQKRYKKYCYRKRVPFGSGILREDLEQIHGFFRTLVFGPSIENRNMFALRVLRQRRVKTLTSGMLDQLVVYCERIPVDEDDPITTRALNGAFKVKFICEALAGMFATRWDEEAGRWSSEFETDDALDLLITALKPYDDTLRIGIRFSLITAVPGFYWSMENLVFQQYIRALTYICRQHEYHSEEWERILKTRASRDIMEGAREAAQERRRALVNPRIVDTF